MKVITICGSMKFKDKMIEIAETLALKGNCIITPMFLTKSKDSYTKEELLILKDIHKEKIKLSNSILVVNINNYIGESTKIEIDYATLLNKEIIYYTDLIK